MRSEGSKIYVGNLPDDIREREVEDLFYKYGRIRNIKIRGRHGGPAFAFVEFVDSRDARDAIQGRDGIRVDGSRIRVEMVKGNGPRGRGGFGGRNDYQDVRSRRGNYRQSTGYSVRVSGLPPSGSWQDLKDHMRSAGEIAFADVYKDGTGVVEFRSPSAVDKAIDELDNSEFTSHEKEKSRIQISRESKRDHSGSRSRSRTRSRSRSRTLSDRRSRSRSHSHSHSRSPSPKRSRSRSDSPAKSRSRTRTRSPSVDRTPRSASRSPKSRSRSGSRDRCYGSDSRRSYSASRTPTPE
uniref:RRM domain-containing protein n=1 Tax=Strongyloides stercoralis TaxID=6248 RepID=A0AAF5D7Z7_STRER